MKVKELLKELKNLDPEEEVLIETRFGYVHQFGCYNAFIKYDKESDDYEHEHSNIKKKGFRKCFIIDNT